MGSAALPGIRAELGLSHLVILLSLRGPPAAVVQAL
jgi:hypothetical protein